MVSDAWNRVRQYWLERVRFAGIENAAEGRSFSTFSIIYGLLLVAFALVVINLLRRTIDIVPPFIMEWFDLFQIREIFRFEFLDDEFVLGAYETFIRILVMLIVARLALAIVQLILSRVVLLDDRLVVIEHVFLYSRVHHIPYERIVRLSMNRTILHRIANLGTVTIVTGDLTRPLKFGPIPRISQFVTEATARMQRPPVVEPGSGRHAASPAT